MAEQIEKRKRILSGIQPTGTPTLGNYIGAVRNWALLQSDYDCLYMVADLHALTVRQTPANLRRQTREMAARCWLWALTRNSMCCLCKAMFPPTASFPGFWPATPSLANFPA